MLVLVLYSSALLRFLGSFSDELIKCVIGASRGY